MANNTLLASDNFASGSLAAGWTNEFSYTVCQVTGTPKVTEPASLSAQSGQLWNGLTWPADQISEITGTLTSEGASYLILLVRFQLGSISGYQANISNGAVTLYREDAGTATQLATLGSLTFAAGDVWTMQAAGSCISVYRNGTRMVYYYDTTYTSGYPGYAQYTSANLTHTKVASWRGYKADQKDGVWTKKGIVIPALSADLPYGVANCSNILHEGNAQLLSGTVFKMWFTSWSANAIGYAESSDGLTWTRKSSNVISGLIDPGVIKNGSTYYLYGFDNTGGTGQGKCHAYTSSDGITWTSQSSDIGITGKYFFQPFTIVGGTWYAIESTKLCTSSDGLSWTEGSVVFPAGNGGAMSGGIVQVGSTWYAWTQNFNSGSVGGSDGTEIIRLKCTDNVGFTTWVTDVHSAHISQGFESVNTAFGQCVPGGIISSGNQTFFYCTECPGDIATPAIYQIGLLVAPTSLSNLVSFAEDAMPQVASDAFPTPGSLSGNWTAVQQTFTIVSGTPNVVEVSTVNQTTIAVYTGSSFGDNQYSEVKIHFMSSTFIEPVVRASNSTFDFYSAVINGSTGSTATVQVQARPGGGTTNIGPQRTINLAVDDLIRLEVYNGSDGHPILTVFQNNYCILQVEDYGDNYLSGGYPGMVMFASTAANAKVSAWSGGNSSVLPAYPAGGGYMQAFRNFANKHGDS
jgi:hypothetical protein